jgi:hypothetical protein
MLFAWSTYSTIKIAIKLLICLRIFGIIFGHKESPSNCSFALIISYVKNHKNWHSSNENYFQNIKDKSYYPLCT